jgi:hypothetical protein
MVYRLIELALILPVATTTVEIAFSTMNIIKNELRNKMNDERERDMFATVEDGFILKTFQGYKSRKCHLPKTIVRSEWYVLLLLLFIHIIFHIYL